MTPQAHAAIEAMSEALEKARACGWVVVVAVGSSFRDCDGLVITTEGADTLTGEVRGDERRAIDWAIDALQRMSR